MRIRARSLLGALTLGLVVGSDGPAVEGSLSTHLAAAAPSTITVINTNDSGPGSLRQAISDSLPDGTIDFDSTLNGLTITLTSAELLINKNLSINGPGAHLLSLSGNDARRVFNVASGTVSITGLTLFNGRAPGTFSLGGAILSTSTGNLFVGNVVIRNNVADSGGGGIAIVDGTGTIENSAVISNNTGGNFGGAPGGGLYVTGPSSVSVTVNNSTFYGNRGFQGGGVAPWAGTTNLNSVTIAGNTASFGNCGGMRFGATVILNNSIVAGNTDQNGTCDLSTFGGTISGDYNLIRNAGSVNFTSGGSHNIVNQDALLGALGDNGGTTPTMALCAAAGVPHSSCLAASPAINAANPSTPGSGGGACEAFDQRGIPRPLDDNGNGVFVCDIGAYEAPGNLAGGGPEDQTIDVTMDAPLTAAFGSAFDVAAAATSGLAVAITTTGGCSGSGSGTATITMTSSTATCVVHYNQPGDADYNPAPEVTTDTTAGPASQTITVTTAAPASAAYNSTFGVAATASSGLAVAITTTGGCSGSGSGGATITMTSGTTTCVVHYNQAGNADYFSASEVLDTTSAVKANATVTLSNLMQTYDGTEKSVGVSTNPPGLNVSVTYNGVVNEPTNAGSYAVQAAIGGPDDSNYAGSASGTLTIGQAGQTIAVTTSAPAAAPYDTTFNVAASSSSGLPVAITASGSCSGSGIGSATVTMTSGNGNCSVRYNQAGNVNYLAAPQISEKTTAQKLSQTIMVLQPPPATASVGSSFTVSATASSGLPVTVSTSGSACSSSGFTITFKKKGTCTVSFSQSGNTNYAAAPKVQATTTVQ